MFTGKTNDPKKNPLEYKDKITFLRAMFPHMNIMDNPAIRTPWEALEELGKQYDEVVMVVGSDRKDDFEQQMRPYLKDFGIEKFSIVSSGERDADSNDVSGMSASKARAFARAGDFKSFSQSSASLNIPPYVSTVVNLSKNSNSCLYIPSTNIKYN